jgi:putative transposase
VVRLGKLFGAVKIKLPKGFNADLNGTLNLAIKKLGKKVRGSFLKLKNWIDKLSRANSLNPA